MLLRFCVTLTTQVEHFKEWTTLRSKRPSL
jgi:hypothetical protein